MTSGNNCRLLQSRPAHLPLPHADEYITKAANADALVAILTDRVAVRKEEDAKDLIKRAGQGDT